MKKILISVSLIFFLIFFPSQLSAEEKIAPTIDYQLPYPGILPDSPLYILKTFRDQIEGFLISNPFKKAEFNLLKADTRISAALSLIEKKNTSLALTTIEKAENYFSEALNNTREAKIQGIDIRDFVKRLVIANKKHQEALEIIEKKIEKKDRKKFEVVKKRIETLKKIAF